MTKRTRLTKHVTKVRKKRVNLFAIKCDDLCNRLQQSFTETLPDLAAATNLSLPKRDSVHHLTTCLMERVTCRLETLQLNYVHGTISWRCFMEHTDYDKKPEHGYLFPSKVSSFTSPSMSLAVIICYIRLCKQVGHFI